MFQTGVLLFSMLQSDNPTLNSFLYAIGVHSNCFECTLFFYKYATLRDSNTYVNDSFSTMLKNMLFASKSPQWHK